MPEETSASLETELSRLFRHPAFMRLQAQGERFRAFDALGMSSSERAHTDFLAFLLRPTTVHGLQDSFLWDFLSLIGDRPPHGRCAAPSLPIVDRLGVELPRALVYRERYNIDILIDCLPDGPVIGIEAKIWAGERDQQLADYQDVLRKNYARGRPKLLVFLTLDARAPGTAAIDHEVPIVSVSWPEVVSLLHQRIGVEPRNDVAPFVKAFIQNIQDLTMNDPEDRDVLAALFKEPTMARLFRRIEKGRPRLKDIEAELVAACEQEIRQITGSKTTQLQNRESGEDFVIWLQVSDWAGRLPIRFAFYHHTGWESNGHPGFNIVLAEDDLNEEGIDKDQVRKTMQSVPGICDELQLLDEWYKKYQVVESPLDGKEAGWIIRDESFDERWIEKATNLLKEQLKQIYSGLR